MARTLNRLLVPGGLWLALALVACNKDSTQNPVDDTPDPPATNPVPDFSLADVNSTSATFNTMVSPRDHLGKVSAWYFGHST
jgi:hypothetical protein